VLGTLLLVLAGVAWQLHAPSSAAARGVMVASFAIAALAFFIRGVSATLSSVPTRAFSEPTLFESGLFLACYAAVLATTFGFLMLHKDRADATLRRVVTIDPVTGAYNRITFREIAEREFSRARRASQPLSLVLLDIDPIVDSVPAHTRLPEPIVKRFAEIVRAAMRKEDLLVRFGDSQFLVVLPDIPGPGAVVVAGRIRREVEEEPFQHDGKPAIVTVSAGVAARLDEGPESIDTLLARADEALALAQRRGRNRVVALSLGRSIAA
jgi:diguanylate cyclase (GGDEF)-like protein